jgi:rod shape-determining protein MreC
MTLDHQYDSFNRTRATLSLAVAPLQYFVDRPVVFFRWVETNFATQQVLLMENAQLRARQLLIYAKLQKVLALERENAQLRALLKSSAQFDEKVNVAQLLAVDLAPYTQQIIVDKGKNEGVYVGQPVLDAYGVMGQVIAVGPITSRILLVTDSRSAIPVQNNRNGNRAILVGLGYDGVLELSNVPITVDFQKGDVLVTSGLDGLYPPGYPIGTVSAVKRLPGERFASISVTPSAHVNQSRQVLLVWPKLDKNFVPATSNKNANANANTNLNNPTTAKKTDPEAAAEPVKPKSRRRLRRRRYFNDGFMGID